MNPQFYAFRWITLLLTQEFSCPDVVRLWDSMLSDPAGRSDCLQRICVAMLLNLRDELLQVRICWGLCQGFESLGMVALVYELSSNCPYKSSV